MNDIKKRKIHVVTKYFFPIVAGIELNILETYKRLAEMGWDVTIHTSKDVYLEKNTLPETEIVEGLKIKRYHFRWYGFLPKIDYESDQIVSLHNFDIFPHGIILLTNLLLKITSKKKSHLILVPHGGYNPLWTAFPLIKRIIKKTYHQTLAVLLINLTVDAIRPVSEWEKEKMTESGINKNKQKVIVNGLENEAFLDIEKLATDKVKNLIKNFDKYIVQIGRLNRIKNYETTIQALALLPKDIHYIIAGPIQHNDDYQSSLKKLVSELDLENRVHFIGVIEGVDKYYLIKHSQMMVHMALWESYCNVIQEAMSQGKVCVVANNTALPYIIKDGINGYCVETKNSKQLAEKINFVLENKNSEIIKKIEETNKKQVRSNSWDEIARQVNELYSSFFSNK